MRRASGSTAIRVLSYGALTYTPANWDSWQIVRVAATRDAEPLNRATLLRCSAAGLANLDLFAIEADER